MTYYNFLFFLICQVISFCCKVFVFQYISLARRNLKSFSGAVWVLFHAEEEFNTILKDAGDKLVGLFYLDLQLFFDLIFG